MVRIATSERDRESAYKLWSQCFTDSSSYIEYYFSQRFKKENYILVERDGNIMGGMHCNPYFMNFYGDIKKTYYLVAIGTYPEYRGEGVLKELMDNFFQRCQVEGVREVFLLPINPEIYSYYGFSYTHYLKSYKISLKNVKGINHKGFKICELKEKKSKILEYINRENMKFQSSLIKSSEEFSTYVDELNFEGGHLYYLEDSNGDILGTFSYNVQGNDLILKDLYFENSEVLEKVLYFISTFKEYYKNLKIDTDINQELESYFSNRKELEIKTIPFMMTKIIDIESALKIFFLKNNFPDVKLKIYDNYRKKIDYYTWKDGKITVENNISDCDIETDRQSLTSLLYGGVKIETLKKQKKIILKKEKGEIPLSQTLRKTISYIHEYV